ncbi:hypothetical protein H8356DRAFT_1656553, partial [Neocallimastix lanati (nom. inval.)]
IVIVIFFSLDLLLIQFFYMEIVEKKNKIFCFYFCFCFLIKFIYKSIIVLYNYFYHLLKNKKSDCDKYFIELVEIILIYLHNYCN